MQTTRVLDHNEETGTTIYYHFDPADDSYTLETVEDVTDIVEVNKWAQNEDHGQWGELAHVGHYPPSVLLHLMKSGILDDPKRHKAWLNDPDNRAWRVRLGRV